MFLARRRLSSSNHVSISTRTSADKFVAPVAAAAGLSVEETAAAIGVLSNAGIQGEMAGSVAQGRDSQNC